MAVIVSEVGNYNRERPTVTKTYLVDAVVDGDVRDYCLAFLGGMLDVNGQLVWTAPDIDQSGLICLSANWEKQYQAEAGGDVTKLVAEYGYPEQQSQDIGTLSCSVGVDMLQLPQGNYTWSQGTKNGQKLGDEDIKPFRTIATSCLKFTLNNKVDPDFASIGLMAGKINSSPLYVPGFPQLIDTKCARFDGFDSQTKFNIEGLNYWEVTYNFTCSFEGWNKLFDGTQFSSVTPAVYEETEMNGMFYL